MRGACVDKYVKSVTISVALFTLVEYGRKPGIIPIAAFRTLLKSIKIMKAISACKILLRLGTLNDLGQTENTWAFHSGYSEMVLDADWIRQHERGEADDADTNQGGAEMAAKLDSMEEFKGWREFDLIYLCPL